MVHEAEAAGISVMAHAQATDGIKTAVRNGVRSIEHGIYLDDEAIELMLDWGTWLVPTLAAPRAVLEQAAAGVPYPDAVLAKARMVLEEHTESVRRAIAAGVTVAMGTDSGVGPHGRNLSELQLMVELRDDAGAGAARGDPVGPRELLDVADDRGTIEPGQRADLVVLVDGDARELAGAGRRGSAGSAGTASWSPGRRARRAGPTPGCAGRRRRRRGSRRPSRRRVGRRRAVRRRAGAVPARPGPAHLSRLAAVVTASTPTMTQRQQIGDDAGTVSIGRPPLMNGSRSRAAPPGSA